MNYYCHLLWVWILIAINQVCVVESKCGGTQRPNIVFVLADDAGWNDFSFHGSAQIPTPNIDTLALTGVILNSYYGSPLCTPSRGSILTGKFPIHIQNGEYKWNDNIVKGLQHYVIMGSMPDGLPLEEKLLPEYLKELGYATHLVGKWHLGHGRTNLTPTRRGFDTHFGYWLGKQDYYDHVASDEQYFGYDFRDGLNVSFESFGVYNTDLFTERATSIIKKHPKEQPLFLMIAHQAPHRANEYHPLQAPKDAVEKFANRIADSNRRHFAGMVDKLDESVGLVVEALSVEGLLSNSIIIFASDNGAAPEGLDMNYGSNWPLRGAKNTLWEGGTRLTSFIWSPLLQQPRVSKDLIHAADWLPTLLEAAGGQMCKLDPIDGLSHWPSLTEGTQSPRKSFLYNIDDQYNNSAIRFGPWKLIQGNTSTFDLGGGNWDGWYGPSGRDSGSVYSLIPEILSSTAAKALASSGILLNESSLMDAQEQANIKCRKKTEEVVCNPYVSPCLFHIDDDPCELRNLAKSRPHIVQQLLAHLDKYNKTALTPIPRVDDVNCAPWRWGYVWTPWKDHVSRVERFL